MVSVDTKFVLKYWFFVAVFVLCAFGISYALGFSRAALRIQYSASSCPANAPANTVSPASLGSAFSSCTSANLLTYSSCMAVYELTCPDTLDTYQPSGYKFQTVNGVAVGGEAQAAKGAHDSFLADTSTLPACAANYVNGGWISYYVYESYIDAASNSLQVYVSSYRDAVCSKSGNATFSPISVLSGTGGTGGGLNSADTTQAVKAALDSSTLLGAMNDSLQRWGTFTGGGAVNIDYGQMSNAVASGLNNAAGTTPGSLGLGNRAKSAAYSNSSLSSFWDVNFKSRLNTFVSDVKATPLFSSFTLGGLANVSNGTSAMNVPFGRYGNASFDFATYASTYNYVKGFLLLLASYLAVRILVLKR